MKFIYDSKPAPVPITPFVGVVFLLWALHGGSVALVAYSGDRDR